VGGKYLVYYNPVENTVFCGWDRLVEGVELQTPTQPPEKTPTRDTANARVVLNTLNFL